MAQIIFTQALVAAWILVAVAFAALGVLLYVALRSRTRPVDLEKAIQDFRSLDIEAFRNLVDGGEEAFLRESLPPKQFRRIKRQRAWAALLYAWEAGRAATALARIGQAAHRNSDAKIAAAGAQVAENAVRLRLQTVRAGLFFLMGILLPDLPTRPLPALLDQYEAAAATLLRLGRSSFGVRALVRSESVLTP